MSCLPVLSHPSTPVLGADTDPKLSPRESQLTHSPRLTRQTSCTHPPLLGRHSEARSRWLTESLKTEWEAGFEEGSYWSLTSAQEGYRGCPEEATEFESHRGVSLSYAQ